MLARWHHEEWATRTPHLSLEDRIARFEARASRNQIPTAFAAVLDSRVVGVACLVEHDMDTRKDLTPWLASVLVAPSYRGRGIGSALSERAVEEARALDVSRLFLFTFDKQSFYSRLGWSAVEQMEYLGAPATIMVRGLAT